MRLAIRSTTAIALVVSAAALAGCQHREPTPEVVSARIDINADRRAGDITIPDTRTPSLDEILTRTSSAKKLRAAETAEGGDRLRSPALRDTALSFGARAGLASASREINGMLKKRAPELTRVYDFNRVLIQGPSGSTILPPVISEAEDAWESQDAGKTLRVADTIYEIKQQAQFTPVAPLWHTYLIREYSAPDNPPEAILPKNAAERDAWKRWVTEGWRMGEIQAREIFESDMRRLERDFTGMVRYKSLLEEGKVLPPVVAEGNLGTTGTGQDMRVNDRAIRITRDPLLNVDGRPGNWEGSASPENPQDSSTARADRQNSSEGTVIKKRF